MLTIAKRRGRSASRTRKDLTTVHRLHNRWITAYIRELRRPNCSRRRLAYCVDRMCTLEKVTVELERQKRGRQSTFVDFLSRRFEISHPDRGSVTLLSMLVGLARQFPSFS